MSGTCEWSSFGTQTRQRRQNVHVQLMFEKLKLRLLNDRASVLKGFSCTDYRPAIVV